MHSALPRVTARKPSYATSVTSSHAKFGTWLEILFVPETSENSVRVNPGNNAVTRTPVPGNSSCRASGQPPNRRDAKTNVPNLSRASVSTRGSHLFAIHTLATDAIVALVSQDSINN